MVEADAWSEDALDLIVRTGRVSSRACPGLLAAAMEKNALVCGWVWGRWEKEMLVCG